MRDLRNLCALRKREYEMYVAAYRNLYGESPWAVRVVLCVALWRKEIALVIWGILAFLVLSLFLPGCANVVSPENETDVRVVLRGNRTDTKQCGAVWFSGERGLLAVVEVRAVDTVLIRNGERLRARWQVSCGRGWIRADTTAADGLVWAPAE